MRITIESIKPQRDQVLVRREDEEKVSSGGIIIPDTARKEKAAIGVVEAIGRGKVNDSGRFVEVEAKVGQRVIVGRWLGHEVDLGDGLKRLLIRDEDILAVVE